jgi:hypothetical protein
VCERVCVRGRVSERECVTVFARETVCVCLGVCVCERVCVCGRES